MPLKCTLRLLCGLLLMGGVLAVGGFVHDSPTHAQTPQDVLTGRIDDITPYVEYTLNVVQPGLTAVIDLQRTTGSLDTLLYLVDDTGGIIAENDDRQRGDRNSLIEFPQIAPGQYSIIATRYNVADGDSSGEFEMSIDLEDRNTDIGDYRVAPDELIAAGFPAIDPHPQADWTIIAYYGADTDLEPGLLNDFNEFELAGGSTDRVRVIMMLDRHPEYSDADGDWDTTRIFELHADVTGDDGVVFPPTLDTPAIADLGELDTGRGEVFAQFLVWAVQNYPADRYAVAMASHGAAWKGLIQDYTGADDILTLPELQQAFAVAQQAANVDAFELLINDSCSMSSVEYYTALAPYFRISYGSPEVVIDPALDMTKFANTLKETPDIALGDLGQELVDTYINRDILLRGGSDIVYFTHAVTDLNKFDPVGQAVEDFARLFNRDPQRYARIVGEARANTYTYSHFIGDNTSVDLGNFMQRVISATRDEELIEAAEAVIEALQGALIHSNGGEEVADRISYYNIYFPESSSRFRLSYFDETSLPEWGQMLRNYYNAVTPQVWTGVDLGLPFHPPVAPRINLTSVYPDGPASILVPVTVGAELVARNLSHVDSVTDQIQPDGSAIRLASERVLRVQSVNGQTERLNFWRPGVETVSISWDVTLPVVSDGTNSNNELLIITGDVAFMDGVYRAPGGTTYNEVSIVFGEDKRVTRIINRAQDSDALGVINIEPGSEFIAYRAVISPDGRVATELGNSYTWPEGGLTWQWQPAPNGEYEKGFLAQAFGGTTGFDSVRVTVDNSGASPDLRGEVRTDFGFNLVRPADVASPLLFLQDANGNIFMNTTTNDGTTSLRVYIMLPGDGGYDAVPADDLSAIATTVADKYNLTINQTPDNDASSIMVGETSAVQFTYTRAADDGDLDGRAFAVYDLNNQLGFVVAVETVADATGGQELFDQLVASSFFFNPRSLTNESTWRRLRFLDNINYWMNSAWQQSDQSDTALRYTPVDGTEGAFMSIGRFDTAIDGQAIAAYNTDSFDLTAPDRVYRAANHTWDVVTYNAVRNAMPVVGRFYTTTVAEATYAIWVEAPEEQATGLFASYFEPIVDGMLIE